MKAWEHHNRIIREKKLRAARDAARAGELKTQEKQAVSQDNLNLLLQALDVECKRLDAVPQGSARQALKRELVNEYLPVVEKYLESGEVYRNPALTQVLIWLFDIGEIDQAMKLARAAIAQQQPLPAGFKRDIRTAVADFVLEWAEDQKDGLIEPYFGEVYEQLFPAEGLGWQVHEDIKIKYVKIAVNQAEKAGEWEKALKLCELAEKINPKKAQVKTRKEKFAKAIAKAAEAAKRGNVPPRLTE